MRLERRPEAARWLLLAAPFGAVAFTLAVTSVLVAWAGAPVGRAYALLLEGGFGSRFAVTETLTRATPLIHNGRVQAARPYAAAGRLQLAYAPTHGIERTFKHDLVHQMIGEELLAGPVDNVGLISCPQTFRRQPVDDSIHADAAAAVERPHQFGVSLREVVVRCDHMAGQPTPTMQHPAQGDSQRLAFARGHLHQQAVMHGKGCEQLHRVRRPVDRTLGSNRHRGQRLDSRLPKL